MLRVQAADVPNGDEVPTDLTGRPLVLYLPGFGDLRYRRQSSATDGVTGTEYSGCCPAASHSRIGLSYTTRLALVWRGPTYWCGVAQCSSRGRKE